ncbi:C-type lectin domain family 2 member D-like [Microcaecilia unicolor]|uniref:C-type lectin domain family 2 member D-like n=1 Tax=Microcaecilia unicolor TaxID=1415580 RepID=A0A6P7WR88_9AMPH|nr:C-type lectin domain family 2 member D-like [Microcaecilia unicolor]
MGLGAAGCITPELLLQKDTEEGNHSLTSFSGESKGLCRRILVPMFVVFLLSFFIGLLICITIATATVACAGKRNEVSGNEVSHPDPCADGWMWYKGTCYFFSEDMENWDVAQSFCTSQNSSLAYIKTQQELDYLMKRKGDADYWIGLRRGGQGQSWKWTDGSEFNNTFTILQDSYCVCLDRVDIMSTGCNTNRKWICSMAAWSHFIGGAQKKHGRNTY